MLLFALCFSILFTLFENVLASSSEDMEICFHLCLRIELNGRNEDCNHFSWIKNDFYRSFIATKYDTNTRYLGKLARAIVSCVENNLLHEFLTWKPFSFNLKTDSKHSQSFVLIKSWKFSRKPHSIAIIIQM